MNGVIYIAHKEGDELTHYGVSGMKWGVRREIGRDAKSAAIARGRAISATKQVTKLTTRIDRRKASGRVDNRTLLSRLGSAKKDAVKYQDMEKTLSNGLSDKDIRQGRRAVKLNKAVKFILIGSMGKATDRLIEDGQMALQMRKRKK